MKYYDICINGSLRDDEGMIFRMHINDYNGPEFLYGMDPENTKLYAPVKDKFKEALFFSDYQELNTNHEVISNHFKSTLEQEFPNQFKFYPVTMQYHESEQWWLWILPVLDCLDTSVDLHRHYPNGELYTSEYVIDDSKVVSDAWRHANYKVVKICTDRFRKVCIDNHISGITFRKLPNKV